MGYAGVMKNVALVLAGVAAGTLLTTILVPRVLAEGARPSGPQKWQQLCEPAGSIAEASSMAGARGAEGWELVGFFGGALCFKRPVSTDKTTDKPAAARPVGDTSWPGY
jgi:hypothetical protein